MTEFTFFSGEPNDEFKAAILAAGHKLISWTPPKKQRKNSRHAQRQHGDLVIDLDDEEQRHTIAKMAEQAGVPFVNGAVRWPSHG
jgi:hypothetical protein